MNSVKSQQLLNRQKAQGTRIDQKNKTQNLELGSQMGDLNNSEILSPRSYLKSAAATNDYAK